LNKKVIIGSDHAGFAAKEQLKQILSGWGYTVKDVGCESDTSCDYPDYAQAVARGILQEDFDRGVLICGTGIGMSIAANRFPGIRAALCTSEEHARLSRLHNDSNVLCLGSRLQTVDAMQNILKVWLDTAFAGGRHLRRIQKIENRG